MYRKSRHSCLSAMSSMAKRTSYPVYANSMVFGFDLEKVPQASASGESVQTGMVQISLQNVGTATASPTRAYVVSCYSGVLELKDTGAFVYT